MDVIPVVPGSTNDTTNKVSSTMQHVLVPQTPSPKDASLEGKVSTTTAKHSNGPPQTLTIDQSLETSRNNSPQPHSAPVEYSAQIPYNPNRPPPYTYQRQHTFPPFPELTRHPVLPFITTAFTDQDHLAASQSSKQRAPATVRPSTGQRNVHSSHISTIPTMDVSKNDPTAIFIHPPFVVPPPPEGEDAPPISESEPPPGTPLTYAILHAHRNWFLDADDFGKDNPNRIDYPPELEPPRGWAPLNECLGSGAIKKQKEKLNNGLRTKGSYVTPEQLGVVEYGPSDDCHELTVLRCTFCRREYHGPNAKSMWRRHVYDKHKVAMKNRREGSAGAAIRNMLKKPKGQVSPDPGDMTSPADPPQGPLDLNNEQNIIRLLERVVSGDLQLCLPASVLGGNSIDLQTIANALHASGITVSLNNNNLEIVSPCQPEVASNLSGGLREIQPPTDDSTTSSQSISVDKPPKDQGSPKFSKRDAENGEERKSTAPRERTPLKDNTFADRNYHNSAITPPGTPRKDKTKQRNLSNSPAARFAQNVTPVVSPSRTTFHYYSNYRSLTSTALRARALATTGEESYLTLLASSPSTTSNSPMKPLNHNTPSNLNRSSPFFKVKPRGPGTSDDIGILGIPSPRFSFHLHMEPSDNSAYMPSFDPVEVNSEALTPIAAILAPPVQVDEKPSSAPSTNRTSKGENNEDTSGELALRYPESSPLNRVQRRRSSKNDDKEQEDFDMDHFIDLKDSGTSPTAPSSPQKISLSRGFAKEFGLLSQEEVDRIAGSLQPGFSEDFRNPKRRRIGSPV